MKRSIKFGVAAAVVIAAFAMAKASQAQGWGFHVDSPGVSFGATGYGHGGYAHGGYSHGGYGGYGYQHGYAAQHSFVGHNPRPAFHAVPDVHVAAPYYYTPPAHVDGYYRHQDRHYDRHSRHW